MSGVLSLKQNGFLPSNNITYWLEVIKNIEFMFLVLPFITSILQMIT